MKMAVSSKTTSLDGGIDQRFGRCKYFLIIDPKNLDFTIIENQNLMATGGAGVKTAELMIKNDVDVIITGSVGPNAFQILFEGKTKIFTDVEGNIKTAIEQFNKNELIQKTRLTDKDYKKIKR